MTDAVVKPASPPMPATGSLPPRLPDWPERLGRLVAQRLAMPFAWGPNDCASFAADACQAMTGRDGLAALRGPRRSEREAWREIRAAGSVAAALVRAGACPVPPALAQRGDLVMLAQGRRRVLAVCLGGEAAAPGPQGLALAPLDAAVEAWRL